LLITAVLIGNLNSTRCEEAVAVSLPPGVKPVWDFAKAKYTIKPTRERICLNGLWRWQPAGGRSGPVAAGDWGCFKVPGCWPGITDYMQKDCQRVYSHPNWNNPKLAEVTSAWYQREIKIPADWRGRRIALRLEYLNSYAMVYLDDKQVGEVRFPGG